MRQKINRQFTVIALFSVVITTIVMTAVFYAQLKKQVFSDLAVVADILTDGGSCERKIDNLRITLIDTDGKVPTIWAGRKLRRRYLPEPVWGSESRIPCRRAYFTMQKNWITGRYSG